MSCIHIPAYINSACFIVVNLILCIKVFGAEHNFKFVAKCTLYIFAYDCKYFASLKRQPLQGFLSSQILSKANLI